MAGDWIKMRTSLLTNPKVNGIARMLESSQKATQALTTGYNGLMSDIVTRNVMRHVTVSLLMVVWGAANEHTKDGIFHNADLSDIDDMVGVPGFGNALVAVGWAEFDDQTFTVALPNFNEYNTSGAERGADAKTNAQRQKEYRDRKRQEESNENVTTECVTGDNENNVTRNRREEKRREEKSNKEPKSKAESATATRLPADWMPSEAEIDFCKTERPDLRPQEVASRFKDYWIAQPGAKGRKTDWPATWRNWVRNERATPQARGSPPAYQTANDKAKALADRLTGRTRNEQRHEIIDITPTTAGELD